MYENCGCKNVKLQPYWTPEFRTQRRVEQRTDYWLKGDLYADKP
jgi:hypothetical protein